MNSILFVDDDPNLLSGLKRGLHPLRNEWTLNFAGSAGAALDFLVNHPVDVIVSDYRMPEMDGYELLFRVQRDYPRVIRIILTGQPDRETYTKAVGICHYFLWKPLDIEVLRPLLRRLKNLGSILSDERLTHKLHGLTSLPTLPDVYLRLTELLDQPESDVRMIIGLIREDAILTMQILKMVNSAFIGLVREITSIDEAVQYLGLNTLRSLVLARQIYGWSPRYAGNDELLRELRLHSIRVARLTEGLVSDCEDNAVRAYASFSGLLHDIGKLVLIHCLPDDYRDVQRCIKEQDCTQDQAERRLLGTDHAAIGAYLVQLWGLPHSIAEAIYLHHQSNIEDYQGLSVIAQAVWHANRIVHGQIDESRNQLLRLRSFPGLIDIFQQIDENEEL